MPYFIGACVACHGDITAPDGFPPSLCPGCTPEAVHGPDVLAAAQAEAQASVNDARRYYDMDSWADVDPACDCIACQGYPDHPIRP